MSGRNSDISSPGLCPLSHTKMTQKNDRQQNNVIEHELLKSNSHAHLPSIDTTHRQTAIWSRTRTSNNADMQGITSGRLKPSMQTQTKYLLSSPNTSFTSISVMKTCIFPSAFSCCRSGLKLFRNKKMKSRSILVCCNCYRLSKQVSNLYALCFRLSMDTALAKLEREHRVIT